MPILRYSPNELNKLPSEPGIYKYYNQENILIYVGKAKNIKKRVSSYFSKSSNANRKTLKLVNEIFEIEFTIAASEFDALLLENNLIKENQPKYNILLKDDKTFPYICILRERFPRIISTRKYNPKKGEYFGPYSSVVAMNNVLELISKLYTIRTCKFNLSESNINKGNFKVCLEYHIKNCKGPCEGLQTENEYLHDIAEARNILTADTNKVRAIYKEKMNSHAQEHAFELAQEYKERIDLLDKYQNKNIVVNTKISDTDVFTILSDSDFAYVNYLRIKNGNIIFTRSVEIKKKLEETEGYILSQIVYEMRLQSKSESTTIYCNVDINFPSEDVRCLIPKIGDKRKLIDMSLKNAFHFKKEKQNEKERLRQRSNEAVKQLQRDLKLINPPNHIECFDNSNILGTNPVSAMVCFKRGKPSKKDYRHYKIKTVEGPDDFASMYEVVYRRYKRLIDEEKNLPNLILIDGGKGQLSSAVKALKDLTIYGKIPIAGIAKRLEEIYVPDDHLPIHINKKSPSLKLIQQLRDEAHRFAINFHRKLRSNNSFKTELENINGIGKTTANKLLKHFKSLKKIKEANVQEIVIAIGSSKAKILSEYLSQKKES
ncbi:MAG: excinuclease ABC subunit UvrC [Cyclobacteriaceae bacterium]|nr:excinuclease ABC subunit UvrC [Cyclobacteriaceae bacterium]